MKNSPIRDSITEMGVAHFFKPGTADKRESSPPNFHQIWEIKKFTDLYQLYDFVVSFFFILW